MPKNPSVTQKVMKIIKQWVEANKEPTQPLYSKEACDMWVRREE